MPQQRPHLIYVNHYAPIFYVLKPPCALVESFEMPAVAIAVLAGINAAGFVTAMSLIHTRPDTLDVELSADFTNNPENN
jgi:hypothetical protein